MNLYEHFSCFTIVPIEIDDVIDHLYEQKVVDRIRLIGVPSMEPKYLRGFCQRYWKFPQAGQPASFADIYYSTVLSDEWQRVVICKELTHTTNKQAATARTRAQVDRLITDLVNKAPATLTALHQIDAVGLLHGLCILFPRDAAVEMRQMHSDGKTHDEIAKYAALPPELVPVLLSPEWEAVIESII